MASDDDDAASLATEYILRLDDQRTMTSGTSTAMTEDDRTALISRLRTDLQHERALRKDVENRLNELREEYEGSRQRSRDLNNQLTRVHTEVMSMRHEKTALESRTQELSTEIAKLTDQVDFYKQQAIQEKVNYEKEMRSRMHCEEQVKDGHAAVQHANGQISALHSDKRSRLIAEEQYRAAIVERDRTIKRSQTEIDQLTSRLADSSKLSDANRSDKREAQSEIEKLRAQIKQMNAEKDIANEERLRLLDKIGYAEKEALRCEREVENSAADSKQLSEQLKRKTDECLGLEKDSRVLVEKITDFKNLNQGIALKHEESQLMSENELFALRDALRISRDKNSGLEKELRDLHEKLTDQINSQSKECVGYQDRLKQVETVASTNELRNQALLMELEKAKSDRRVALKKLKKERSQTASQIDKFDKEAQDYKKRTSTLEPLIEKMAVRVDELATDRQTLSDRITYLETENMQLSKELHAVHSMAARQVKYTGLAKETKVQSRELKKKELLLTDQLNKAQSQLEYTLDDARRQENENLIHVNTITDLQMAKARLEAKISILEDKDRGRLETLQKMTDRADQIARDAQEVARIEQKRSNSLSQRCRHVQDKLRDRDLELEMLRSKVQVDKTLDSLRR